LVPLVTAYFKSCMYVEPAVHIKDNWKYETWTKMHNWTCGYFTDLVWRGCSPHKWSSKSKIQM